VRSRLTWATIKATQMKPGRAECRSRQAGRRRNMVPSRHHGERAIPDLQHLRSEALLAVGPSIHLGARSWIQRARRATTHTSYGQQCAHSIKYAASQITHKAHQ
jgi:hypothetical protein